MRHFRRRTVSRLEEIFVIFLNAHFCAHSRTREELNRINRATRDEMYNRRLMRIIFHPTADCLCRTQSARGVNHTFRSAVVIAHQLYAQLPSPQQFICTLYIFVRSRVNLSNCVRQYIFSRLLKYLIKREDFFFFLFSPRHKLQCQIKIINISHRVRAL